MLRKEFYQSIPAPEFLSFTFAMSLSSIDLDGLNELLGGLMSTQNDPRKAAEETLETSWRGQARVGVLLLYLATNAANGSDDTVRSFCAILFRRMAIRSPKDLGSVIDRTIGEIDESVKTQIRDVLLKGFVSQQVAAVRRKLADAIAEVAREDASPRGTWPDLIPNLFDCASSQESSLRECAFRVLSSCPEIIETNYIDRILLLFEAGFEDGDDEVRIAACTAFVSFFRESPRNVWLVMSPLLPSLLNSLPRFLENAHDEALANVLESLVELAEMAPRMFKEMFPKIIEFCSTVCKNRDLEVNARLGALELLTTFAEVSPAMCKLTSSYASTMVMINLSLLTEVSIDDEDAAEWNNNDNTEDDEDEPEYEAARQSLDRISLRLGGQSIATHLFLFVPSMCRSTSWRECFAALMALSACAEGCADLLIAEIPKILDLVLPCIDHPHSRVQFACCNALGQISTDFAGVIQRTSGDRILPALISKLTDKSVFKVQKHAAAALVNFCEAASNDVLDPFLDSLLNNLLALLQSPKRYVQEQVLTTIAIIADAAQKKFVKYHDALLPLLVNFLKSDLGEEYRLLKAKCVECATLISSAVGKDIFSQHSDNLIDIMIALQETCTDVDDPLKSFLEQGWGRICKLIGKDFVKYLPLVLPPLLQTAKAAQDISFLEEDEAEEFNNSEEWDVINLSGKLIAVHTAALDDKVTALDLLRIYAVQLREDFFPWVGEIAQEIAIPALDFYLHDGVRASSSLLLASLFKSVVYATGARSQETSSIWEQICVKLSEVLRTEPVPELLMAYHTSLVECMETLDPQILTTAHLDFLAEAVHANLNEIYERIKNRDGEGDQFTEDVDDSEEEVTDEELLDELNRVITCLFKIGGTKFAPFYEKLLAPLVSSFIVDDNPSIKLCGLSVVCDIFKYFSEYPDLPNYLKYIITEGLTSPQAEIRQGAAHAIALAAQHEGSLYPSLCLESLPILFQVATFPDAKADENLPATENCVNAIARVCQAHGAAIGEFDHVISQWLALLPVLYDEEAASSCFSFLSILMQNEHPAVKAQSLKVVESVLLALFHKAIRGNTAEVTIQATRVFLSKMPHDDALKILRNFPDQEVISKYFTD